MAFDRNLCYAFLAALLLASQAGAAAGEEGGWGTVSSLIDDVVGILQGIAEKLISWGLLEAADEGPENVSPGGNVGENMSLENGPENVSRGNYAPTKPSEPSGPQSGKVGSRCSYVTSSADRDGDYIRYTFDWGDNTTSITSYESSCMIVIESHAWSKPGNYSVRAKATDERGASSAWSSARSVMIAGGSSNGAPSTPSIPQGPTSGRAGTSYSFSTLSRDPEGDRVKYTLDWGDKTTSETGLTSSGIKARIAHRWNSSGTYKVKARAADEKGIKSSWCKEASMRITGSSLNSPPGTPSVPSGPATGSPGGSCIYSTVSKDPDGDKVSYVFDWGDGKTSDTGLLSSGISAKANHSWEGRGNYSVRCRAFDSRGNASSWSGARVVAVR